MISRYLTTLSGYWLEVFERFFLVFSIPTWTDKISRAIQKERKVYLWDAPRIKDPSARFENMVALELYRAVTLRNDIGIENRRFLSALRQEQGETGS